MYGSEKPSDTADVCEMDESLTTAFVQLNARSERVNRGLDSNLVRQVNEITKKEVSVIQDMSTLPENEQMQFWHEEFMPLATKARFV